jgi:hypothetical protein
MNRSLLAIPLVALFACSPAVASTPVLRVMDYCGLPGSRCLDRDDAPGDADLAELNWCCGYDGSPCVLVTYLSSCDPEAEYAVICDWGASLPDGSIECYE